MVLIGDLPLKAALPAAARSCPCEEGPARLLGAVSCASWGYTVGRATSGSSCHTDTVRVVTVPSRARMQSSHGRWDSWEPKAQDHEGA